MKRNNDHYYKIKYNVDHEYGSFHKNDRGDFGLCDALLYVSILFPEDGSYSQQIFSVDGRNEGKPLDVEDMFRVWSLMAATLIETLDENKQQVHLQICKNTFEMIKEFIVGVDNDRS